MKMLKLMLMVLLLASTHTRVSTDEIEVDSASDEWCHKLISFNHLGSWGSYESRLIELSANNIFDHGGLHGDGDSSSPSRLFDWNGVWNPDNYKKLWFVIFDFKDTYTVKEVKIHNSGDSVHDVTSFEIESSSDSKTWTTVQVITNVESGTSRSQYFQISGEGRYWKLTIKKVASTFQPWVKSFAFFGEKYEDKCNILDSSNRLPVNGQTVYLEKSPGYWWYPTWQGLIGSSYYAKKDITDIEDNWPAWTWHTSTIGEETFYHLEAMRDGYKNYFMFYEMVNNWDGYFYRLAVGYAHDHTRQGWTRWKLVSSVPTKYGLNIVLRRPGTPYSVKSIANMHIYAEVDTRTFSVYIPPQCKAWNRVGSQRNPSDATKDAELKRIYTSGITTSTSTTKTVTNELSNEIQKGLTAKFGGQWSTTNSISREVNEGFWATIKIPPGKTGVIYQKVGTYGKYKLHSVDFAACYH